MKLLSIKLLALACTATTTAIANDDNETNNNLILLRGSSSPLLISSEEEGACEVDGSLHPRSRRWTMRSPSKVCEEESSAKGTNYTIPYKCSGPAEDGYPPGVQYACCEEGLGDEMTSLGGKECTKEENIEEELVA